MHKLLVRKELFALQFSNSKRTKKVPAWRNNQSVLSCTPPSPPTSPLKVVAMAVTWSRILVGVRVARLFILICHQTKEKRTEEIHDYKDSSPHYTQTHLHSFPTNKLQNFWQVRKPTGNQQFFFRMSDKQPMKLYLSVMAAFVE